MPATVIVGLEWDDEGKARDILLAAVLPVAPSVTLPPRPIPSGTGGRS